MKNSQTCMIKMINLGFILSAKNNQKKHTDSVMHPTDDALQSCQIVGRDFRRVNRGRHPHQRIGERLEEMPTSRD